MYCRRSLRSRKLSWNPFGFGFRIHNDRRARLTDFGKTRAGLLIFKLLMDEFADHNQTDTKPENWNSLTAFRLPLALAAAFAAAMILQLFRQGRLWWCKLADYAPATAQAWSTHTSQHFFDPYSLTHVLHGVLFFWLTGLIFGKARLAWRFCLAIGLECAWEVLENTNAVIERYREATASLDYFGDSIANSAGDVLACALGFWIASRLRFWRSLAFFLLVEIVLLVWIRDSLLLNIVMLLYPLDAVKAWQTGGG